MQFQTNLRNVRRSILNAARIAKQQKPDELNLLMYTDPPTEDISIMEFEEMALRRLRVLKVVEDAKERYGRNFEELKETLYKELSKLMPIACGGCLAEKLDEERRWDRISHFILRLAFCKTPEQTKWFIQQELDLFRFRFQREIRNRSMVTRFLALNNFKVEPLTVLEKDELCDRLSGANGISAQKARCIEFWKVPFVDALDLVKKRKAYLWGGFAHVSEDDLVIIVCAQLRLIISAAMARACKYIGFIEEEDRLIPLLNKLTSRSYIGKAYIGNDEDKKITLGMIDKLAVKSFPLCMRYIHHRLRNDHHLRHGARMQYGLFLKGIGLSLEDALTFWRAEFTKRIDSEKFDKQYAYNIRHNYGKEGRRVEYSAYSCMKIILGSAPSAMDCHGCPYRHCDPQVLAQRLVDAQVSENCIQKILSLSKSAQYDKACTAYFEYIHKLGENELGTVITHPNQYFELSTQVLNGTTKTSNFSHGFLSTQQKNASEVVGECDEKSISSSNISEKNDA